MEMIFELIRLTSVGIVAGLFSSFLGNWSFRHKKWWELRVDAYQSAIESLSDLLHYYDIHAETWDVGGVSEKKQEQLREIIDVAMPKIRKLADSGSFLFSDEANIALRKFVDFQVGDITDPDDYYRPHRYEAAKCLKELVSLSKIDLRIRTLWL